MKRRVTFSYDGDHEVQYLRRLPHVGDRVRHTGETWAVARLDSDASGLIALCRRPARALEPAQDLPATELG